MTELIREKDRLPENENDVLVYYQDDDHISVGFFINNIKIWDTEIPWAPKGKVTHWMPLPNPPEEL